LINAVLFDLFETLITESRARPTRASSLGAKLGLEPEAFRVQWRSRRPRVILGQLSFAEALCEVCESLSGRVDRTAIRHICEQRARDKAAVFEHISDNVAALMAELSNRDVRLGVISNCFEEDVLAWPACSLARHVQCAVFSWAEGLAKPNAEIYHLGIRRLGVEPATAVFVGNGDDDELVGAERAGLRAFRARWFSTLGPEPQSRPESSDLASTHDVMALVTAG
jgi:FMN phosphatase YigB (HAD superfamily)